MTDEKLAMYLDNTMNNLQKYQRLDENMEAAKHNFLKLLQEKEKRSR
jgi:hypothetical protein